MRFGSLSGFAVKAALSTALVCSLNAQAPAPAPAPDAAAAPDPPKFMAGPIKFQGYVDGYYSFNNNHPASRNNGYDRFFDIQANQFSLNMAGFYMSMDPDPVGFTLQLG